MTTEKVEIIREALSAARKYIGIPGPATPQNKPRNELIAKIGRAEAALEGTET